MAEGGFGLNFEHGFRPMGQGGGYRAAAGGGFGQSLGDYFGKQQDFLNQSKLNEQGYANQRSLADRNNAAGFAGQALQAQTSRYNTDVGDATNRLGIGQQAATAQRGQDVSSATQRYLGDQQTGLGYFNAQTQDATARYRNDTEDATQRYGIDTQAVTAKRGQDTQFRQAQLQAEASKYPAMLHQQRYDQLAPQFRAMLGETYTPGGGQVGAQPAIAAGPVWSDAQVQQQVNSQRAGIDARTAGQVQDTSASVAGRGFGGNSPLAMALAVNERGQGLAAGANAEQATRWNAAQGNAEHLLASQQAQEGQFASRQNEDIQRRQLYQGQRNALLSALAGIA